MLTGMVSIIFLSAIILGVFVILQHASIVDLLVGFICATLPLEWIVEVRGVNFSIYDLAFALGVPIFGIVIVRHRYYRNRQFRILLALFALLQVWNLIARFAHRSDHGIFQILWSDYKNNLVGLVFLLTGIVLASRPQHTQRRLLWILLAAFAFEACVGIVQTATGGVRLNSSITGRYLGFLTTVPSQEVSSSLIELQGDGTLDNGIFVGSIFRAVGTHLHSNYFAVSMIPGLALCMGVLSVKRYRWLHRWAISVGCVLLAALALSFTRTGYVAFMAMCVWQFVFWRMAGARRRTIMFVFIGALTLALIPIFASANEIQTFVTARLGSVALERIQNIFRPNQAGEFNFRTTLWRFALARVQSSPWFGVDPPITLRELFPTLLVPDRGGLPLHNQVISSIYYGGYVAGTLYVIIHLWLLWLSRKLHLQVKELSILNMWVIAANLCLVGLAIESITIDWMPLTSMQGIFWLVAGVVVMQYRTVPITERAPAALNARSQAVSLVSRVGSEIGDRVMNRHALEDVYPVPDKLPPTVAIDQSLPLFSIVTPSYNQGGFIRETIESVLRQDYPNIEHWVIDGGSTDETIAILQSYEDNARFHWISEKDRGQSDAINKGLVRCRGDLFSWLNSDDLLAPNALKHVAAAWVSFGRPVLLYGLARSIDSCGADLGYCATQSPRITLQRLLKFRNTPIQPATFAPTDLVREIGGVDTALHYTMDFDLWVRLAEQVPIHHIPHDLAFYRLHPSSKTVALSTRFAADAAKVLDSAAQRGLLSKKQARVRANLFAARTYLTPEVRDFSSAFARLKGAINDDVLVAPEAMFILLKALARPIVGEKLWAGVRLVRAKC